MMTAVAVILAVPPATKLALMKNGAHEANLELEKRFVLLSCARFLF